MIGILNDVRDERFEQESHLADYEENGASFSTIQTDTFVQEWIDNARGWDDYLDRLCKWAEHGGVSKAYNLRFSDRSRNETALATKLMRRVGSFEDPEGIVRRLMSDLSPPKWSTAGESYRNSVVESAKRYSVDCSEYYELSGGQQDQDSAPVIQEKAAVVIGALSFIQEDRFRTEELSDHHLVSDGISRKQIQRVLSDLEQLGYLRREQIGQANHWIIRADIPATGRPFELLVDRYRTCNEVKKQRREYCEDHSID